MAFKLPMPNATLTKVKGAGASEDYDQAGGTGADKWTGSEGVYFTEDTERLTTGEGDDVIVTRQMVVPADLPIAWARGDILSFTRHTQDDMVTEDLSGTVRAHQRSEYPGAPGVVRLHLENT